MNISDLRFYQIAVASIALVMIFLGVEKYVRKQATQSFLKLAVRLIVWGGMGAIALFPDLSDVLAQFIGIEGNINAVVLIGFLLIFLIIFKILSVVERIEQDISTVTRKEAIENAQRKSKT